MKHFLIFLLACSLGNRLLAIDDQRKDSSQSTAAPSSQSTAAAQTQPLPKKRANKTKADVEALPRLPSDLNVVQDIIYKRIGDTELDLLLFVPVEKRFRTSPLVVYIHGGGWGGGDKYKVLRPDILPVIRELNRQGVTCASIEYRLANGSAATAYDSATDCKDAIRYLISNSEKFGIDTDNLGTFGSSAGGHLTLVTALGRDEDFPCAVNLNDKRGTIRCVAAYYPLTSFVDPALLKGSNFERPQRMRPILGGLLDEKRDIAEKLSPVLLLRSNSPAILVAHGDEDEVLSFQNSIAMRDAAQKKGVSVECIISKSAGHGFSGEAIEPTIAEINQQTTQFFLQHLIKP